jgi:hypothetical protein
MTFDAEMEKSHKIHMEPQSIRIAKVIMREKNKTRGITILDFKIHYKVTVITSIWCQCQDRQIDQ